MTGPLVHKGKHREGGFLRPGDKERDIYVTSFEIEVITNMKVKPFYKALHNNLATDGWGDPTDGGDKFESLYWERILEDGFKEHHVWWRLVKYPHDRGTGKGFSRWACKVDFQTIAVKGTEIAYKGKKKKVENADFIIRCWFWVQWDFNDLFKKSFIKSLQQRFQRQLFKDELEQEKENLTKVATKLQRYIKTYLDLEDIGEQPPTFEPQSGYKDQFNP